MLLVRRNGRGGGAEVALGPVFGMYVEGVRGGMGVEEVRRGIQKKRFGLVPPLDDVVFVSEGPARNEHILVAKAQDLHQRSFEGNFKIITFLLTENPYTRGIFFAREKEWESLVEAAKRGDAVVLAGVGEAHKKRVGRVCGILWGGKKVCEGMGMGYVDQIAEVAAEFSRVGVDLENDTKEKIRLQWKEATFSLVVRERLLIRRAALFVGARAPRRDRSSSMPSG
uniref:Uncharacterized protein n=1 Tax=Chromera velia CCMP2878 TaxID=1169474 RepID=A0A0G4HA98_9ALVE|eukprot:Cvel_6084.t1-p1 / transcript=Cvel_6084.t1 / gene=Cvel_6084 / organism=Chromera_velia_CCMP2878 / gene_product=hypothetical protein / transcript_product=hypothetical protein / location=Cvel_scaffold293:18695-23508(+) / protein_length=224 / sequence_SO=supercontig / SO=protein_coding / is_pseudo=false